jgi:hypothetical protein
MTYVVSVNANAYYVGTDGGLATSLQYADQSSVADGGNGVYGSPGVFPVSSYHNTNYFRDVQFTANATPAVVKVSGDGQVALTGTTLQPLVAKVIDSTGNAVTGATVTFAVTAGGGHLSATSVSSNSAGTASTTLTLGSSPGANTVTATVSGYGSTTFSATAQQATVLGSQTPASTNVTDNGIAYELGMKFQSSQPGMITAIQYWKAPSETGTHVGHIWSSSGTSMATANFTNETASGWQLALLSTPLPILPNTIYVVSVNANAYYVATNNGLATSQTNYTLSSVADGANGVYGTPGNFPTQSYQTTDYFRDVSFTQSSIVIKNSGDQQAAAPGTTLPNPLVAKLVNSSGQVVAGATVTFSVTAGGGSVSPTSAVTNSSGLASTTLTLGSTLGTNTVHAAAGSVGSADFSATAQAYTVMTTQAPALTNVTDNSSYELGMKFQSSKPGRIMFIRYWKSASETGTHTGTIWSAAGAPLVQVPFSGETASGWQVQMLPTPLQILANMTYVVSVNANSYYVATNSGLATAVVDGPVSSVADGANGVFIGTPFSFPTASWQNSNYFRDVGFLP